MFDSGWDGSDHSRRGVNGIRPVAFLTRVHRESTRAQWDG
jgi:hypothetical protein